MKKALAGAVLLGALLAAPGARATSYYVSPNGSGSTCSQAAPCALTAGAAKTAPGDVVYLAGGAYAGPFTVPNSGTAAAWITYQAADGALPIFDGPGNDTALTGVGSSTATYIRLVGLVARNWSSGFANGWKGSGHTDSNGHWQFIDCIADQNNANGIAFRSATEVLVQECIVAHSGASTDHSGSSGVDLYGAQGTPADNVVQRTVAFENADMQQHTDGSGYIVDDIGTGASFINDIGFRNGGSCIRLTTSSNTHIINNSCYGDGLDVNDTGPSSPGEIFFSGGATQTGVVLVNNLAVATGSAQDGTAIFGAPSQTVSNNYTNTSGAVDFWTDAAGLHPDFHLNASATGMASIIDKGATVNVPAQDIGFDPRCITKTSPGGLSWWSYSIDYTYIAGLGGVAKCFHPAARPVGSAPDVGAYEYGAALSGGGGAGGGGNGGATGRGGAAGGSGVGGGGGGGATSTGGAGGGGITGAGGIAVPPGSGGVVGSGGGVGSGGIAVPPATGGMIGSGGLTGTGGMNVPGSGGRHASGGVIGTATGGVMGSGGVTGSGGTTGSGGVQGSGGAAPGGSGGSVAAGSGGITATGGRPGSGGILGSGGTSGLPAGSGGHPGSGGASSVDAGSDHPDAGRDAGVGAGEVHGGCSYAGGETSSGFALILLAAAALAAVTRRRRPPSRQDAVLRFDAADSRDGARGDPQRAGQGPQPGVGRPQRHPAHHGRCQQMGVDPASAASV